MSDGWCPKSTPGAVGMWWDLGPQGRAEVSSFLLSATRRYQKQELYPAEPKPSNLMGPVTFKRLRVLQREAAAFICRLQLGRRVALSSAWVAVGLFCFHGVMGLSWVAALCWLC